MSKVHIYVFFIFTRFSCVEKELPNVEEKPSVNNITVNGIDSPTSERSRSPSPTLEVPCYQPIEPFNNMRPLPQNSYSSYENNLQNDLYVNYGSDISQILKEANSFNNALQYHIQDVKKLEKVIELQQNIQVKYFNS